MSSRDLMSPRLPSVPAEITTTYVSDLVRALETFLQSQDNPGLMRGTKLTLTTLPTSDTGLEEGTLWRIGNNVVVSLLDYVVFDGLQSTVSVGSVTVNIS
tara:strand:+ start:2876 stop:3175 length:300 start_codon:yes stop_codon:yes gene_type:complete